MAIIIMYLCQLRKSETVSDILTKIHTNVKHYKTVGGAEHKNPNSA